MKGSVHSIQNNCLTIKPEGKDTLETVEVVSDQVVTLNGNPCRLQDLEPGDWADFDPAYPVTKVTATGPVERQKGRKRPRGNGF